MSPKGITLSEYIQWLREQGLPERAEYYENLAKEIAEKKRKGSEDK